MRVDDKKTYIEEEAFGVRHSGEIPEVTLHESLYHLREDPDGPRLQLNSEDILPLKQAVVKRYRAIILRDLDPGNRDKSFYRGLARCSANWQRLLKFCSRENIDLEAIKIETAEMLQKFLREELLDVKSGRRPSSINCANEEIAHLAECLGISSKDLPQGWQKLSLDVK